ncbi:hypothetical protein TRFO_11625 [Tritrichomonas foetus]|uniref:Uncharacterized protein n=1 Tax=Tritrichomonas foetus TaxID=1144522 RepID=A0A1J4J7J8_9EUKA|nr:hypothetical protein TRFO_11625 [Tritrichomonas foetus]|eukprot:OHS93635.1 hypothetical protein TRFO_11625 [Tritrichomonas foetus]
MFYPIFYSFPLLLAALFGYNDVIRLLLTSPDLDINKADREGNTALMIAVETDFIDTIKLLLSHPNIDIKHQNEEGVFNFLLI